MAHGFIFCILLFCAVTVVHASPKLKKICSGAKKGIQCVGTCGQGMKSTPEFIVTLGHYTDPSCRKESFQPDCIGSVVHLNNRRIQGSDIVITSGTCAQAATYVIGADGTEYQIENKTLHPERTGSCSLFDIAVVKVEDFIIVEDFKVLYTPKVTQTVENGAKGKSIGGSTGERLPSKSRFPVVASIGTCVPQGMICIRHDGGSRIVTSNVGSPFYIPHPTMKGYYLLLGVFPCMHPVQAMRNEEGEHQEAFVPITDKRVLGWIIHVGFGQTVDWDWRKRI